MVRKDIHPHFLPVISPRWSLTGLAGLLVLNHGP
jgi:hypothetical protein